MTETRKQDAVTESVKELHRCLEQAEAVVIGAGSGLSAAAGFTYSESVLRSISGSLSKNME